MYSIAFAVQMNQRPTYSLDRQWRLGKFIPFLANPSVFIAQNDKKYRFSKTSLTVHIVHLYCEYYEINLCKSYLDTVHDFLIKLGIKPHWNILEISIFSLNHVVVRPTKIMNNLLKDFKIRTFKANFQHQRSTESFWFFFLWRIFD